MTRRNNHDAAAIDINAECEQIYATVAERYCLERAQLDHVAAPVLLAMYAVAVEPRRPGLRVAASQDETEERR